MEEVVEQQQIPPPIPPPIIQLPPPPPPPPPPTVIHQEVNQSYQVKQAMGHNPKFIGGQSKSTTVTEEVRRIRPPPPIVHKVEEKTVVEEVKRGPRPPIPNYGQEIRTSQMNVVQETKRNQMIPPPRPHGEIIRQEQTTYQEEIHNGPPPRPMYNQTQNVVQETRRNQIMPPHGPHGPHGGMIRQEQTTYQEEIHTSQPPEPMYNQVNSSQTVVQETRRNQMMPPHGPHGPPHGPHGPPHGPHGPPGGMMRQEQHSYPAEIHTIHPPQPMYNQSQTVIQETRRNQMMPPHGPHGPPHGPHGPPGGMMRQEQMTYQEEIHSNQPPQPMYNQSQTVIQETRRNQMMLPHGPHGPPHGPHGPPGGMMRQEQMTYQEEIHSNQPPQPMYNQSQNIVQETRRNQMMPSHGPHGPFGPHGGMIRQEQTTYQEEIHNNQPPQPMYSQTQTQNVVQEVKRNRPPMNQPHGGMVRQEQMTYQEEINSNQPPQPMYSQTQSQNVVQEVKRNRPPMIQPHGGMVNQSQYSYQQEESQSQNYGQESMGNSQYQGGVSQQNSQYSYQEVSNPPQPQTYTQDGNNSSSYYQGPPPPIPPPAYNRPPMSDFEAQRIGRPKTKFQNARDFVQLSFMKRNEKKSSTGPPPQPIQVMNTGKMKNMVASMNQHFQQSSEEVDQPIQIIEGDGLNE